MVVLDVSSGFGPPLLWSPVLPVAARLVVLTAVATAAAVVAHRSRGRQRLRP